MSSAPKPSSSDDGGGENGAKDAAVAKTAGFVVFSGIAMSIIKALAPKPCQPQPQPPPPPLQISSNKPAVDEGLAYGSSSARTIEIVKGDTLWGLSRTYGVSIDAIKEANGITGDTIYAGKKLVIP